MINKPSRNEQREKRHLRVRKKVYGTAERPRLNVFRSNKHMYAQIINDDLGVTVVAASTLDKEIAGNIANGGNKEAAKLVGQLVAKKAIEKGIKEVVFDRGGYIYHGRVKELADAAREAGLDF
ncbi:50S ribosomal protein L18 [Fervidicella metallireducens AeB]|uniref:Large ribosomal subunit protein uL18 n=1 Tax=Fervidicella metallireducens AeB TaxID=1403537 RepID=A0A017RUX7_9CLOT|nr:50S ribosomal protein L18 [Fervidicella metallireducens]EYE87710.1 50S ribosomal protein L18 [Fervidicella metallireducens AeB]